MKKTALMKRPAAGGPRHLSFRAVPSLDQMSRKLARCWDTIEARTRATLHAKLNVKRAAGWRPDGETLEVIRFGRNGRPGALYFCQEIVCASLLV